MTTLAQTTRQHSVPAKAGTPFFANFFKVLWLWNERAIQRRHLSALTQRELEDIGISREAADQEAGKPFWRA